MYVVDPGRRVRGFGGWCRLNGEFGSEFVNKISDKFDIVLLRMSTVRRAEMPGWRRGTVERK